MLLHNLIVGNLVNLSAEKDEHSLHTAFNVPTLLHDVGMGSLAIIAVEGCIAFLSNLLEREV
jgi:hypothetical protein